MRIGPQVAKMIAMAAGGREWYSVRTLADKLGLCRPTIKKYFWESQEASLQVQQDLSIADPERDIFWLQRLPGGTIGGIKANILWD